MNAINPRRRVLAGLRVNDDEESKIRQLAAAHGMTVAEWQRTRALTTGPAPKPPR